MNKIKSTLTVMALLAISSSQALDFGRIMLVGDSLTEGHGTSAPTSYRRYLNDRMIANNDNKDFVGPHGSFYENGLGDGQNAGFGGWGINEILTGYHDNGTTWLGGGKYSDWMTAYSPDTIVFIAGGNDSWQWDPYNNSNNWYGNVAAHNNMVAWYRSQYQIVFDQTFSLNANARFLIGSYPKNEKTDPFYRNYQNDIYSYIAPLLQDMVLEQRALGRNVQYIPIFEGGSDVLGTYTWDGVHFNATGAGHYAGIIYDQLANPVPEPASMVALVAAIGLIAKRRRK